MATKEEVQAKFQKLCTDIGFARYQLGKCQDEQGRLFETIEKLEKGFEALEAEMLEVEDVKQPSPAE